MNRQQAIELARKIDDIRKRKRLGGKKELSYTTLLRLAEMDKWQRDLVIERLVREGYAKSVEDIKRLLMSKRVSLSVGEGGNAVESAGMSDDILDAGIQYLGINQDLI